MLRFAADDRYSQVGADERVKRGEVRRAVVDPRLQCWKLCANAAQRWEVVPVALDRVEISDIEGRKRINREQAAHDIGTGSLVGESGDFERPIGGAIAHLRADDRAAHEVNDRDDLQVGPPSRQRQRPAPLLSLSQLQASASAGPAVLPTMISRRASSASTSARGSMCKRLTSTAPSITAACARLNPWNGACEA